MRRRTARTTTTTTRGSPRSARRSPAPTRAAAASDSTAPVELSAAPVAASPTTATSHVTRWLGITLATRRQTYAPRPTEAAPDQVSTNPLSTKKNDTPTRPTPNHAAAPSCATRQRHVTDVVGEHQQRGDEPQAGQGVQARRRWNRHPRVLVRPSPSTPHRSIRGRPPAAVLILPSAVCPTTARISQFDRPRRVRVPPAAPRAPIRTRSGTAPPRHSGMASANSHRERGL